MEKKANNYQKIKLLRIMEILRETDEDHALKTSEICSRLRSMNITCDTRTLGKDMRFLFSQGYDIQSRMEGHEKAYYTDDFSFSVPEVKILMDAVQAASFITEKKANALITKISSLAGKYRADVLNSNLIHFNANRHRNESVYYTIANLEDAISHGKKVSFRYFYLDESGSRVFRKNGDYYTEEPMGLVFHEDNYYLICYHTYYGHPYALRVDRMCDVDLADEDISPEVQKLVHETDFAAFTEQAFKMYYAETKAVSIRFTNDLIGTVFDKFGEDTPMKRIDEAVVEALLKVQVSPIFFGWVSQFPGQMEITWPKSVVEEYEKHISKLNQICREGLFGTKQKNCLYFRDADAPPIVVPSYSVETYFAVSEEQAEKEHIKRCIHPELPNNHHVYSKMHSLPDSLYESKDCYDGETIWKIPKDRIEEIAGLLHLDKSDYPYMSALEMIDGDFFWIIAWDD